MAEINIAKQLLAARHEKKITQEELASYVGVSKAAVSKWESGVSFPDITLLPKLATYFNVSIDELIGYEPQLTGEQIKELYCQLKNTFANEKFEVAMAECRELEKKYYSCFPFLLQMAILYLNHATLSDAPLHIYEHCIELTQRIRSLSEDVNDAKEALTLEASCYLLIGGPMKAMELMDEKLRPISHDTELLAQVYQGIGNMQVAIDAYQVAMFQHLIFLVSDSAPLAMLNAADFAKAERIITRAIDCIDIYNMDELHPNTTAGIYITGAQIYCMHGENAKALDMLERYTYICEHCFFPLVLHGDAFFDRIDEWFLQFDLGNQAPRSEKLIVSSMVEAVEKNPAFAGLMDEKRYKAVVKRLKGIGEKY